MDWALAHHRYPVIADQPRSTRFDSARLARDRAGRERLLLPLAMASSGRPIPRLRLELPAPLLPDPVAIRPVGRTCLGLRRRLGQCDICH